MKRTKEEVKRQVEGLLQMKATMPRKSFFGGDNWAVIDAQVNVITGTKKPDYYYVDEHTEEYRDGDNELWSEAERAERWLNGEMKEDLFES